LHGKSSMFYLVCFDIVEDPTRARVVKVLKEYGERVQKSVFECANLNEKAFLKMKSRVEDLIDSGEDTVRYYVLCQGCLKNVELSGVGEPPKVQAFRVV
jgi:CRISPR-associated protein Cas2